MEPNAANPVRIQTSILSAVEKRLLVWIAGRLPAAVGSDHLTLLALGAMFLAGLSYAFASQHPAGLVLATACLAVNWFGDSLDGTVARVRNAQRPRYGFYVDHVVDAIGTVALLGGLGFSGYMSPAVAMLLLLAYMLVTLEIYLATSVLGTFRMAFLKVGPTELRILLATANTWVLFDRTVMLFGRSWQLFDVGGVVAAAALLVTFLVSAARNTRTLYLAERLPPAESGAREAEGEGRDAEGGGREAEGGAARNRAQVVDSRRDDIRDPLPAAGKLAGC
jgi:phosphatidylglycerophosphate synthase